MLEREVPGAGIMVGDEKQRPPPRLSYRATGAGIMVIITEGDGKQRLPPRLSCQASVDPILRGSETENIVFRRLGDEEKV